MNNQRNMYGIILQFNEDVVEGQDNWTKKCNELDAFFKSEGFEKYGDYIYIGGASINAVKCVFIMFKLKEVFPWFSQALFKAKMIRIDEISDLSTPLFL